MSVDEISPNEEATDTAAVREIGPARRNRLYIAAYTLVALGLFCAAAITVWLKLQNFAQASVEPTLKLLCYVFCGGGIGGCLYSMRGLQRHVIDSSNLQAEDSWDPRRLWEYILHPVTGSILGVMSFLFLRGGLLALSGHSNTAGSLEAKAAFVSVAVLAGFSSREFLLKMKDIAGNVFGGAGQH